MANVIKQRNTIYENFESPTELPYQEVDQVVSRSQTQNSIKLNGYFNNLVDNDLYINNRTHIQGKNRPGPKSNSDEDVYSGENGYKSWVDYNGYPVIQRKVDIPLSDSVIFNSTDNGIKFFEKYGENGIIAVYDDKVKGLSNVNFQSDIVFNNEIKTIEGDPVSVLSKCKTNTSYTFYGTTNGLYALDYDNSISSYCFKRVVDNSNANVAVGKIVEIVSYRKSDSRLFYYYDNVVYRGTWKNNKLYDITNIYECVNGEKLYAIEFLENNEKQGIDDDTNILLLLNDGIIKVSDTGTILTKTNLTTYNDITTINDSIIYKDFLYIGTNNGLYKLNNDTFKFESDGYTTSNILQFSKEVEPSSKNDNSLFILTRDNIDDYKIIDYSNNKVIYRSSIKINGFGTCNGKLIIGTGNGISCVNDDQIVEITFSELSSEALSSINCRELRTIQTENGSTLYAYADYKRLVYNDTEEDYIEEDINNDVIVGNIDYEIEQDQSTIVEKNLKSLENTNGINIVKNDNGVYEIETLLNSIIFNQIKNGTVISTYSQNNERYIGQIKIEDENYIFTSGYLYNTNDLNDTIAVRGTDLESYISSDSVYLTDSIKINIDDDTNITKYILRLNDKLLLVGFDINSKKVKKVYGEAILSNGKYIFEYKGNYKSYSNQALCSYGLFTKVTDISSENYEYQNAFFKKINNAGKVLFDYDGEEISSVKTISYTTTTNNEVKSIKFSNASGEQWTVDNIDSVKELGFSYSSDDEVNSNSFYTIGSDDKITFYGYISNDYLANRLFNNPSDITTDILQVKSDIEANFIFGIGSTITQYEEDFSDPSRISSEYDSEKHLTITSSFVDNIPTFCNSSFYVANKLGGISKVDFSFMRTATRVKISYDQDPDYSGDELPDHEIPTCQYQQFYGFFNDYKTPYIEQKDINEFSYVYVKVQLIDGSIIALRNDNRTIDFKTETGVHSDSFPSDITGFDVIDNKVYIYFGNREEIYTIENDELILENQKYYDVRGTDQNIIGRYINIYNDDGQLFSYDNVAVFGDEIHDTPEIVYNRFFTNKLPLMISEDDYNLKQVYTQQDDPFDNMVRGSSNFFKFGSDENTFGYTKSDEATKITFIYDDGSETLSATKQYDFEHEISNIFLDDNFSIDEPICFYTDGINSYKYDYQIEDGKKEIKIGNGIIIRDIVNTNDEIGMDQNVSYFTRQDGTKLNFSYIHNPEIIKLQQQLIYSQHDSLENPSEFKFTKFIKPYSDGNVRYQSYKQNSGGQPKWYLITVNDGGQLFQTNEKYGTTQKDNIFYPGNANGQNKMKYKAIFSTSGGNVSQFSLQIGNKKKTDISNNDNFVKMFINQPIENIKWYDYYNNHYYVFFDTVSGGLQCVKFDSYNYGLYFNEVPDKLNDDDLVKIKRIYGNNFLIIGRTNNSDRLYNYTFEKDSGDIYDYHIQILSGGTNERISSINDYSDDIIVSKGSVILSSQDGMSWKQLLDLSCNSSIIDTYVNNTKELLFATPNGTYRTNYQYNLVYDHVPFTEESAIELYNSLSHEISSVISNAISSHIDELHLSGSIADQLTKFSNTNFEINDNFILSNKTEDTFAISNDYIERIITGNSYDNPFRYITARSTNTATGNIPNEINCSYIVKCYKSGIVDMNIYLPTTNTYYIPHIPGTPNCQDEGEKQTVNGKKLNPNIHENYTTIKVGILSSYFFIDDIYDNVIKGNSLPLKIKKETNPNKIVEESESSILFHSFVEPSTAKSINNSSDLLNINDQKMLEYYCFGTDAQSIRITAYDSRKNYTKDTRFVYYHGNGLKTESRQDTICQIILSGEKKSLYNKDIFNASEDIIFLGWDKKLNATEPTYSINNTVSFNTIDKGDIDLTDTNAIHLYAIWTKYDWEKEGYTQIDLNLNSNLTTTIAEVTVDKDVKPNIKNNVLVDWGQN